MSYVKSAFERVCNEAEQAQVCFVSLYESVPFYGGPEEGGWWGSDVVLVAHQRFPTEELAESAVERVRKLAVDLEEEAKRAYGQRCLDECGWLEARGLDADYLPEPDGPSKFHVAIENQPGSQESQGCRHYE
jgi:hypothetical protein